MERYKTTRNSTLLFILSMAFLVSNYGVWDGAMVASRDYSSNKNAIFLLLMVVFIFLSILLNRNRFILYLPYKPVLILFFSNLFFITLFRSDFLSASRQFIAIVISFCIILFLSSLLHSINYRKALILFVTCINITLIISTVVHVLNVGSLEFFSRDDYTRLGGIFFFGHFAMLAGLITIVSLLGYLNESNSRVKKYYVINIIITIILLSFTDARSVMFTVVFCILLVFFLIRFHSKQSVSLLTKILILISTIFVPYYLTQTEGGLSIYDSLIIRINIWKVSLRGIRQRPLLGFGKENFFQTDYFAEQISYKLNDSHSAILDHALSFGIISLIVFLLFYFLIFLKVNRINRVEKKIFIAIPIYWFIVSIYWGGLFNIGTNFVQIILLLSLIGLCLHPELYEDFRSSMQ